MQTTKTTKKRTFLYKSKNIFKELAPMMLLITIFVALFLIFAYCFYNVFFPLKYTIEIKSLSSTYNVNPALIASMINAESKFEPNSKSNKGAIGLMQIMPSTATFIAEYQKLSHVDSRELTDVKTNLELGIAYVNYLSNKFPDTFTMLCAYNAGEGNVTQWLQNPKYSKDKRTLTSTPFKETNFYAKKIIRNMPIYAKRLT